MAGTLPGLEEEVSPKAPVAVSNCGLLTEYEASGIIAPATLQRW